jgi:hypothetical protein
MNNVKNTIAIFVVVGATFCLAQRASAQLFFTGEPAFPVASTPCFPARVDPKIDRHLVTAAAIAEKQAEPHGVMLCWKYVKNALVASGAVHSRPMTGHACQAGIELVYQFGFVKLPVNDPRDAPLGSVIVYGGPGSGHVEIRTSNGFASDFRSPHPCRYPMIGIYAKMANG